MDNHLFAKMFAASGNSSEKMTTNTSGFSDSECDYDSNGDYDIDQYDFSYDDDDIDYDDDEINGYIRNNNYHIGKSNSNDHHYGAQFSESESEFGNNDHSGSQLSSSESDRVADDDFCSYDHIFFKK